jgi:hypothetical protein
MAKTFKRFVTEDTQDLLSYASLQKRGMTVSQMEYATIRKRNIQAEKVIKELTDLIRLGVSGSTSVRTFEQAITAAKLMQIPLALLKIIDDDFID